MQTALMVFYRPAGFCSWILCWDREAQPAQSQRQKASPTRNSRLVPQSHRGMAGRAVLSWMRPHWGHVKADNMLLF